jgi:diguanylate cyclase (GGDEF)-like protein
MQGISEGSNRLNKANRDIVVLGVAIAAILLFVGIGGSVLPQIINYWFYHGAQPDLELVSPLLLNTALIIFSWRRYRELMLEISQRRKAEEQARVLAETDSLTNCLNRRSIKAATAELMEKAKRSGRTIAVMILDLDGFKLVNDLNGHGIGDVVLRETARRLQQEIKHEGIVARLGGDEFACVVTCDSRNPAKIDEMAARIIQVISEPVSVDETTFEVTASIGIDHVGSYHSENPDNSEWEMLMHNADIAMYHAKKAGRNRYAWFQPAMENELRFRSRMEQGIRQGIDKGEFIPYYEQQIDIESGRLVGFEMLARWDSPELGIVSPEIFIPIAEQMGVISELSESLIKQALQDAKKWNPDLVLSVNISPLQLQDPWFAQKLLKLLTDGGFPPHRLDIEITESCVHENIGQVRSVVTSLKNQGIKISLDDFGTGYSSIAQLRSLPFDRLKIDRSFIAELASDQCNQKLVEAIISLAKGLNLPVTAEGIENDHVLSILRELGQMKGQGYLYGRPEDAQTTFARLEAQELLANSSPLGEVIEPQTETPPSNAAARKVGGR